MIFLSELPSRPLEIRCFDAALREYSFDLRLAHLKRLKFAQLLRERQDELNAGMAALRRNNIFTRCFSLDLLV